MAETAALALIEGAPAGQIRNRGLVTRSPQVAASAALVTKIQTGTAGEVLDGIRELGAIGGATNIEYLQGTMRDEFRPEPIRTAAALAVLGSGDETAALDAIRGLAAIGGDGNTERLAMLARDSSLPQTRRLEAALGLGIIGTPQAADYLIGAFADFTDTDSRVQLLDSLGRFPFSQIEQTWSDLLDDPETVEELRTAAVEALANSSAQAVPFLMSAAKSDRDPNVREMAAWAISAHGNQAQVAPALVEMVRNESEPDVRRRLYEALLSQGEASAATLLPLIRAETDVAARIAGLNAMADAIRRTPSVPISTAFDAEMVPELTKIAMGEGSANLRMRAVFALRRADTAMARAALLTISKTDFTPIAQAALNGLPNTTQP